MELAILHDSLQDPAYRLVTIVEQGGVGKTRLAIALADRARSYFADGVYFVPLAGLSNPAMAANMAASSMRWYTPQEIVSALATAQDLPSKSAGDVTPRHRSLRVVFEHSWRLLARANISIPLSFPGSFPLRCRPFRHGEHAGRIICAACQSLATCSRR